MESEPGPTGAGAGDGARGERVLRPSVVSWALWDWGQAAFNAVIVTFVFSVYVTEAVAPDADTGSVWLGTATAVAGLIIAVLAPVTGQRADLGGRRRFWLGAHTYVIVLCMFAMWLVRPDPTYLLLGVALIGIGSIFSEFAGVNYNAILLDISTPRNIGRISGFGWGMGYVGGIVLLLLVYVAFISPEVGWFGVTSDDGTSYRAVAVAAALWLAVFAVPVLLSAPPPRARPKAPKLSLAGNYRKLFRDIRALYSEHPHTVYFLISSAVFRDGLSAVFAFGGVIAVGTYGFEPSDVVVFAVGANGVAALGAILAGRVDDRVGPKPVIVASLVGLLVTGTILVTLSGPAAFWVCGLLLSAFVGPAQSASRTFLGRLAPPGREGELFGLYATTGRAVSFLGPAAFAGFIALFGAQRWGMVGILLVLLAGLALVLPVKRPEPGDDRLVTVDNGSS